MCNDVVQILDHESISKAVVLGHDFGAVMASRMCSFHPGRIAGLITLGTAYVPPSPYPLDFEQLKAIQEQYQGYCSSWYFPLFTSDRGAPVLDAHMENMFTALHSGGARMKNLFCAEGALERWLTDESNKEASVLPYATEEFRKEWVGRLERDGSTGPLSWYKAMMRNLDLDAQKSALSRGSHVLNSPYLFVAALQDPLAPPAAVQASIGQGMLPDVTLREIDAGHWGMLERPEDFGKIVIEWLNERFKGANTEVAS